MSQDLLIAAMIRNEEKQAQVVDHLKQVVNSRHSSSQSSNRAGSVQHEGRSRTGTVKSSRSHLKEENYNLLQGSGSMADFLKNSSSTSSNMMRRKRGLSNDDSFLPEFRTSTDKNHYHDTDSTADLMKLLSPRLSDENSGNFEHISTQSNKDAISDAAKKH